MKEVVFLLISVCVFAFCAADPECYDLCDRYGLNCTPFYFNRCDFNDTLIITLTNGKGDLDYNMAKLASVKIGNIIIGENITGIPDGKFMYYENLHNVQLLEVERIGYQAFAFCSHMESVTFSDSLQSIGSEAFSGCSILGTVDIPAAVTSIGSGVFANCPNLAINIDSGNQNFKYENSVFSTKDGSHIKKYFGDAASFSAPNNLIEIEDYAFETHKELVSINLPATIQNVGKFAFVGCSSLTSISFGNSMNAVGNDAFKGCSQLSSVTFGETIKSIGSFAFQGTNLSSVNIPDSVTSIGTNAFSSCSKLASVTLPKNIKSIASDCFYNCTKLTSVTIPSSVTDIGDWAFGLCSGLSSIVYPASLKNIGAFAFAGCSMESIDIPSGVTKISNSAFSGIEKLNTVSIAETVNTIGSKAFAGCKKLSNVTYYGVNSDPGSNSFNVFQGCKELQTVYVSKLYTPSSFCGMTNLTRYDDLSAASTTSVSFYVMLTLFVLALSHIF